MAEDWMADEDAQAWAKRVIDELVPKIEGSALTVSIVPRTPVDVKFAVELGVSIMLDKPIILAVFPGVEIPDHLRRVADEIVEIDHGPGGQERMMAAVQRVMATMETADE